MNRASESDLRSNMPESIFFLGGGSNIQLRTLPSQQVCTQHAGKNGQLLNHLFYFRWLNKFNSSDEYSMSSQATAWVKK